MNETPEINNSESSAPKRERWEELYEKYAESVKNPSNLYLSTSDE